MKVTLACPIRMPGVEESRDDSQDVRRYGQEKRDNIGVAKSFDHGGEEISDGS